ncbi:MAG: 3-alpha,7-alpha,12-alpha-trihydroxy-5-beta-cholest-24-enoyl-CoA hydratase [Halieaceae bacterium]|jgi:acyl dehydratase|nr:3-alpha,7-alpha,12-alpha-trihydroxy-5-beta-cholest-24-enoyl-CoA hydratase [Halieaceae bacterium]MBT6125533.1 3-alpha,7-alpha,12-alpha-trihydroxy-5-beta-cholest-24-enoyl-CoA hydratase [Halieaceae bacterium]
MAIHTEKLLNWTFEEVCHDYVQRDAILYALGLGLGRDPLNKQELPYVYEKDLAVLPTFAVTLATPGLWVKDPATNITLEGLVHGAQSANFHAPLPPQASITGKARISQVYDRGAKKGAVVVVERSIHDTHSGLLYCTLEQTLILRADGGFGGEPPPGNNLSIPQSPPLQAISYKTTPGQAILYRLSGDWNPLHIDPDVAQHAGFQQPILHGYCSYGIAGWATCLASNRDPLLLKTLQCQFRGPVIPGDRLIFEFWQPDADKWLFEAQTNNRVVLAKGCATFNV